MEVVPYGLHVMPFDVEWRVVENGTTPSSDVFATRDEAEAHARDLAAAAGYGEIILYDSAGSEESRYAHSPAA